MRPWQPQPGPLRVPAAAEIAGTFVMTVHAVRVGIRSHTTSHEALACVLLRANPATSLCAISAEVAADQKQLEIRASKQASVLPAHILARMQNVCVVYFLLPYGLYRFWLPAHPVRHICLDVASAECIHPLNLLTR